jgi:hypothetical protein
MTIRGRVSISFAHVFLSARRKKKMMMMMTMMKKRKRSTRISPGEKGRTIPDRHGCLRLSVTIKGRARLKKCCDHIT